MKTLTTKIYHADTPNVNGYIYPKKSLEEAIERYNSKTQYVELSPYGSPFDPNSVVDTDAIVGTATLKMEDTFVVATIQLEDTPAATQVLAMIKTGKKPMALPEGLGTFDDPELKVVTFERIHKIKVDTADVGENPDNMYHLKGDE